MRRIRFLVWKELIELRRDPRLLVVVILAPVIQLFMLAYAATTDVRNVPLVVADADRSTESRELIRRFEGSPSFSVVAVLSAAGDAGRYLEDGRAWMVLAIPQGYGGSVVVGRPETLQLVADGSDSNSAGVSLALRQQSADGVRPGGRRAASVARLDTGPGRIGDAGTR